MRVTPPVPSIPYVGRFAPSPSGPLHMGSLVCALASFLDARASGGEWLVRMEDIDPPREQPGAQATIIRTLEAHGLLWDRQLLQQSTRDQDYRSLLMRLQQDSLCYRCGCSRQRLKSLGGFYDGYCREHPPAQGRTTALRLKVGQLPTTYADITSQINFEDGIQGPLAENLRQTCGDFIIHRKDGLFAYQLAVVADDIAQGITHVVRGSDLLETTARQIYLFHLLGQRPPHYSHIPVLVDQRWRKLSKQNHAPAVEDDLAGQNLWRASHCLGMTPPDDLRHAAPERVLNWAIANWRLDNVPHQRVLPSPY